MQEAFNWINTQTLSERVHQLKGNNSVFLPHRIQLIKKYQFLKLNEERPNRIP